MVDIALVELPRLHANRKVRTWVVEFGGEEIGVVEKAPRQQWEARLLGRAGVRPIGYYSSRLAAADAVYRARWDGDACHGGNRPGRPGPVAPPPAPAPREAVPVEGPLSAACEKCGAAAGESCRNYLGKRCAPHSGRGKPRRVAVERLASPSLF
jgi:hypothetical protein